MKKILLAGLISVLSSIAFSQTSNTEIGLHFLSTSTKRYWSMSSLEGSYKTTIGFPIFNDKYSFNPFYEEEKIVQKQIGTPVVFFRQRIYKNWWIRTHAFYLNSNVFNTDTLDVYFGTSGCSYYDYNARFNEFIFGMAPQYQWYNKKRLYINSGIEFNMSLWKLELEQNGLKCGCFYCGPFSDVRRKSGLSFQSFFSTHSIAYRVYGRVNLGFETKLGYDRESNNCGMMNSLFASLAF